MSMENIFLDGAGGSEDGESPPYFWKRPRIYKNEAKIPVINIPIWRLVNTLFIIYALYLGIDLYFDVCTHASEATIVVTLIFTMSYWVWATWWDENYFMPPTWSAIKIQRFHPLWIIVWLTFYSMLVALIIFLIMATLILTYADYKTAFEWNCWGD
jgi:hypothetical protein